jgi:hypothetical protein
MDGKTFNMMYEGNSLIFTTSSFRAEKTSVLHSGVYSREFSSMLFASAACILVYMLSEPAGIEPAVLLYAVLIIVFVLFFLGSKKFIFRDRFLKVIFDNDGRTAAITHPGIMSRRTEKIHFSKIKSVEIGSRKFAPENIDAVHFVQKISLQHGSAVPGLGAEEEFITLSLNLTDGSERLIFAGKIDEEPELPVNEIRKFLANAGYGISETKL